MVFRHVSGKVFSKDGIDVLGRIKGHIADIANHTHASVTFVSFPDWYVDGEQPEGDFVRDSKLENHDFSKNVAADWILQE